MIQNFSDKETQTFWETGRSRRIPSKLRERTLSKLNLLHAAETLEALRDPPGNMLEALAGDRRGQHSIRVNQRYRICFVWTLAGPPSIEFVDYH